MFHFFKPTGKNNSSKTSARRRSSRPSKSFQIERLEQRVVYSTSAVSVPSEISITEGKSYQVPITRTGDISKPVSVKYTFSTYDATLGKDFTRSTYSSTVTLQPGIRTYTLLPVTAVDDKVDEYDQRFYLDIAVAAGSNTAVDQRRTSLTIVDNDAGPNVSISALDTTKGEAGGNAHFRVSLDAPSEKPVFVTYSAQSLRTFNWAQDALFAHYPSASSDTLFFGMGETQRDVSVAIKDDKIIEPTEICTLAITKGRNVGGFGNVKAEVKIIDNDIPTVVVDDAGSINEGNAPGATANFKVRVLEPMERKVYVKYGTSDVDASNQTDYVTTRGTLTFGGEPPLDVKPSQQTVTVPLRADTVIEKTAENFYLNVGPIDSLVANRLNLQKAHGKATIVDDDKKQTLVGIPAPVSAIPTPENGFGMVQYTWAAASNAARYEISLRKENSFFSSYHNVFADFGFVNKPITGTTYSPLYTEWLNQGTYFWKVRAVAADGTVGAWSSEQRFVMPKDAAAS